MSRLTRDGTAEPYRETRFSGAYRDKEIFIFPVQLTTSRIGNLNRLIHTLLYAMTIHNIQTYFTQRLSVNRWLQRCTFHHLFNITGMLIALWCKRSRSSIRVRFCHKKCIKCVLMEGQSRCQQCKRRNTE